MSIAGKVALITGGGKGIGRAIALRLVPRNESHARRRTPGRRVHSGNINVSRR